MTSPTSNWRPRRKSVSSSDVEAPARLLGASIAALLKHHQLGTTAELVEIVNLWPILVGDRMSGHAKPTKIEGDVLLVAVDHPAWATELRLTNSKVVNRLKEELEVTSINRLKVYIRAVSDLD